MTKKITNIVLFILLIVGFIFRLKGIIKELSYWNDEHHVAYFSRSILQNGEPITNIGKNTGMYQIGLYYLTALSFKLFGITEFAGRIPSVIAGTSLIALIFFITKKIRGQTEALIAAFLMAFSQIQLAWSTQLRPYIWMELFTLLVSYFCYKNLTNKKQIFDSNFCWAFLFSTFAVFFHGTGLINFVLISAVIFYKSIEYKKYFYIIAVIPFFVLALLIMYFSLRIDLRNMSRILFGFNWDILHYRVFLTHNYWWLIIGSSFGALFLFKKNFNLFLILTSFISIIFGITIFKVHNMYVRYSLPAFPLLYMLFAIGLTEIYRKLSRRVKNFFVKSAIIVTIAAFFFAFPLLKQKIILMPLYYHSINADVRENPIVDYKTAFAKIKKLIAGNKEVVIMDAWNDRALWYLPGTDFIWLNKDPDKIDRLYGEKMIGTIKEYEEEKSKYKAGIVIIENWESITLPELQNHIRRTLKHEFDVNNLPYNENDKWSLSIYSWGIDN